jgi:DNA recombination protein RmuC
VVASTEILILLFVIAVLLLAVLAIVWLLLRRPATASDPAVLARLEVQKGDVERVERTVRDEQRQSRQELQAELARFEAQLQSQFERLTQQQSMRLQGFDERLAQFTERTERGLESLRLGLGDDARKAREESGATLGQFGKTLQESFHKLGEQTERRLAEVRTTLEARLKDIQQDNAAKLEQMRATVDEKLQATLETRLGESFRQVSERLEQVHRGLGEMQNLATGVGDLKRVLTNVKTRGIWGEVQLSGLIEDLLTREQYEVNVATRPGSAERVEFAIRLPGQSADGTPVWLPIDAKFPREDYERLLDAQDRADVEGAALASAALERRIREEAKSISLKYVEPPHTTNFAILFLPTEGLYAEVARRPGLSESLQRDFRITVAGPTNLCMLLNSLQMGFRTLAIEKRSSEVWQVLGAVKTEFGKFAGVLEKTRKKLAEATNVIDQADVRTRAIERKLRGVEAASDSESQRLLGDVPELPEADSANENGAD